MAIESKVKNTEQYSIETTTIIRVVLGIAVVLIPTIMIVILLQTQIDATLDDFRPGTALLQNDEFLYWRMADSFSDNGLNSGYYTLNERSASMQFSRYNAWGFAYPVLYGTLGSVFGGWQLNTAIYLNIAFISLAMIVFLLVARPDIGQLVLLFILFATYTAFLFHIPSNLQEALGYAIAILTTAVMLVFIRRRGHYTQRDLVLVGLYIALISMVRPQWSFLLITIGAFYNWEGGILSRIKGMAIGTVIAFGMFLLFNLQSGFYSYPLTKGILGFDTIEQMIEEYLWRIEININNLFSPDRLLVVLTIPIYWGFFAVATTAISAWRRYSGASQDEEFTFLRFREEELIFHLTFLVPSITFLFLFHANFGPGRHISAMIIPSLLLFVVYRRIPSLVVFIAMNLIVFGMFLRAFQLDTGTRFGQILDGAETFAQDTADVLRYDPNTNNPWCNTILYHMLISDDRGYALSFPGEMLYIDSRLGISYYWRTRFFKDTIISKYLYMRPEDIEILGDRLDAELLLPLSERYARGYNLYYNRNSGCPL